MPANDATGAVATPDGKTLYVADQSSNKLVNVIDLDPASPTKGTVVASIAVPGEPGGLTMSPDGNTLYATTLDDVVAIDVDPQSPTYKQVLGTNAVSAKPYDVALTPDGTRLYTANSDDTVSVIPTGVVTGTARGSDADGDTLAYSVSGQPAHGAVVIDPMTGAWTYAPGVPGSSTPDSFVITVDDGHGGVASQTVTTNAPAARCDVPIHPAECHSLGGIRVLVGIGSWTGPNV